MPRGSPAWYPHAMLALETTVSIAASSPRVQRPNLSPTSLFRSIVAIGSPLAPKSAGRAPVWPHTPQTRTVPSDGRAQPAVASAMDAARRPAAHRSMHGLADDPEHAPQLDADSGRQGGVRQWGLRDPLGDHGPDQHDLVRCPPGPFRRTQRHPADRSRLV